MFARLRCVEPALCARVSGRTWGGMWFACPAASKTGLKLLMTSGPRHTHHGPKIRERCRAKGKVTGADQVREVLLTGYVEPCEKVVRDAAGGVVICEGRSGGRSDGLRLSQGDRKFRQRWLIPLPGHLEHEMGAPASLEEGVRSDRSSGALASGTRICAMAGSSGICVCSRSCGLMRRCAQTAIRRGPKAKSSHVPVHKGARKGERVRKLPPSMKVLQRAGHSRKKDSERQDGRLRVLGRAPQAGRNWLRQVHVNRA